MLPARKRQRRQVRKLVACSMTPGADLLDPREELTRVVITAVPLAPGHAKSTERPLFCSFVASMTGTARDVSRSTAS